MKNVLILALLRLLEQNQGGLTFSAIKAKLPVNDRKVLESLLIELVHNNLIIKLKLIFPWKSKYQITPQGISMLESKRSGSITWEN